MNFERINTQTTAAPIYTGAKKTAPSSQNTNVYNPYARPDGFGGTAQTNTGWNVSPLAQGASTSTSGERKPPPTPVNASHQQYVWAETTAMQQSMGWEADLDNILQEANPDNLDLDMTAAGDAVLMNEAALTAELASLPPNTPPEVIRSIIETRKEQMRADMVRLVETKADSAKQKQASKDLEKVAAVELAQSRETTNEQMAAKEEAESKAEKDLFAKESLTNKILHSWA